MKPEGSMSLYLAECDLHVEILDDGLGDAKSFLPFSNRSEMDKKTLRILDQIAYRFTKLQDTMGEKVLPHILVLA